MFCLEFLKLSFIYFHIERLPPYFFLYTYRYLPIQNFCRLLTIHFFIQYQIECFVSDGENCMKFGFLNIFQVKNKKIITLNYLLKVNIYYKIFHRDRTVDMNRNTCEKTIE